MKESYGGDLERRLLLVYLGAGVTLTGMQAVLPALPTMQRALEISEAEISLVVSAYLLPSVLLAIPLGLFTDRVGRREVYVGALAAFGCAALMLLFVHSFVFLISMRILQGAAFAAILPLSITMIADVTSGRGSVRAQGRRSVVMAIFETVLPAAGGALAVWAWYGPFSLQLLALPLAIMGWRWLPVHETYRTPWGKYARDFVHVLRLEGVWSLQLLGFSRFIFKFTVLTYFPILAASAHGMSSVTIGLALGAVALSGTTSAALAAHLVSRIHVVTLLTTSVMASGMALLVVGAVPLAAVAVVALLMFGFADGLLGVLQNVIAGSVGPYRVRGGFIAVTTTTRNLGKFLAPLTIGGLLLVISVEKAFLVVGTLAVSTVVPLRMVRPLVRTAAANIQAGRGGGPE